MEKWSLVLASTSPRRKELLAHLQIPFAVMAPTVDESLCLINDPFKRVQVLAEEKSINVLERCKSSYVVSLGSDTVVALEGKIFEKPLHKKEAREMLQALSGKTHKVFTAVALSYKSSEGLKCESTVVESSVTFHDISGALLESYLLTEDSLDKAGAYGVQGMAQTFIKMIQGNYSAIMGLPVDTVFHLLEELKVEFK
jgi:septum formation protein